MVKAVFRIVLYVSIFLVFVGGVGVAGFLSEQKRYWIAVPEKPFQTIPQVKAPEYDPQKPTVAVILGNPTTEVFDFTVPYEMFAMTGAYNVYAVAPDKHVTTLSGGLDLAPHYSFEELDRLLGKSPDMIVVPFMTRVDDAKYLPVRQWLQKHADTELLSICAGAGNVADAGLLRGKTATMHWEFIDQAMKEYPDTDWVRDQRYVRDGKYVGSAGLTSGMDAVLHVISQKLGEPAAEKIAKEMHYPSYHFVKNPKIDPYYVDRTELVYMFNQAFQWNKKQMGVLLYEGMEEGALVSIFDTYAASGTTDVYPIAVSEQPIVTKHNLTLIPRYHIGDAPNVEKMIVPGTEAKTLAAAAVEEWTKQSNGKELSFMHGDSADRFVFEAPLEDLSRQEDIQTAVFGAKRLEYRADLTFEGAPISAEAFGIPLLLTVAALLIAFQVDRKFIKRKTTTSVRSGKHV